MNYKYFMSFQGNLYRKSGLFSCEVLNGDLQWEKCSMSDIKKAHEITEEQFNDEFVAILTSRGQN